MRFELEIQLCHALPRSRNNMKAPGPKPRGFLAFGCGDRIRTGVHGFAGRCLATRPRRSWFNRSDYQMIR